MVMVVMMERYAFFFSVLCYYFYFLQHSWKWFVYYRTQNLNRGIKAASDEPVKKKRKCDSASHFYAPPPNAEDHISYERNVTLLTSEMEKPKPRTEELKSLLRQTYPNRWELLMGKKWNSITSYLAEFPLLKKMIYVSIITSCAYTNFVLDLCNCINMTCS